MARFVEKFGRRPRAPNLMGADDRTSNREGPADARAHTRFGPRRHAVARPAHRRRERDGAGAGRRRRPAAPRPRSRDRGSRFASKPQESGPVLQRRGAVGARSRASRRSRALVALSRRCFPRGRDLRARRRSRDVHRYPSRFARPLRSSPTERRAFGRAGKHARRARIDFPSGRRRSAMCHALGSRAGERCRDTHLVRLRASRARRRVIS